MWRSNRCAAALTVAFMLVGVVFGLRSFLGGPPTAEEVPLLWQITEEDAAAYAEFFGMDAAQREALAELCEGYDAIRARQNAEWNAAIQRQWESAPESESDFEARESKAVAARLLHTEQIRAAQGEFFGDLRLLLTDAQAAEWSGFERLLRARGTWWRRWDMPSFHPLVDLDRIVRGLELPEEARAAAEPALAAFRRRFDEYALRNIEMGREREALDRRFYLEDSGMSREEYDRETESLPQQSSGLCLLPAEQVEIHALFASSARRIEAALPAPHNARFEAAFRRVFWPCVYHKTPWPIGVLDIADGFEDLTESQRDRLAAARASYEREAETVNRRWAEALDKAVTVTGCDLNTGAEVVTRAMRENNMGHLLYTVKAWWGTTRGGMPNPEKTEEGAAAVQKTIDARRARFDLDCETEDRVRRILTREQLGRLDEALAAPAR